MYQVLFYEYTSKNTTFFAVLNAEGFRISTPTSPTLSPFCVPKTTKKITEQLLPPHDFFFFHIANQCSACLMGFPDPKLIGAFFRPLPVPVPSTNPPPSTTTITTVKREECSAVPSSLQLTGRGRAPSQSRRGRPTPPRRR